MSRDLLSGWPCRPLLAALSRALSACGGEAASGELDFDGFSRLTASSEARIGSVDDPDLGFSRIGGVELDRDGNLYVLEASGPEIRVYTPTGSLLRRFGREGGGPGEFEGSPRFGVVGDTVWAVDIRARRITLFDRQGKLLSTGPTDGVQVLLPDMFGYLLPWEMRPDGRFTSEFASIVPNRGEPSGVKPSDRIPVPFVLFDPSGAVLDTVGWAGRPPPRMWRPPSEEEEGQYQTIEVGGRPMFVPSAPTRLPWWHRVLDGYVMVAAPVPEGGEPAVVTVTRVGLAEDTLYTRAIRYKPIPYTDAELDTIAADAARGGGGMIPEIRVGGRAPPASDDWQAVANRLRAAMRFPASKIPVERIWVAQDESTWLRLVGRGDTADWVILDAKGAPRGRVRLPSRLDPEWSRGDVLWAEERDEYDVPWLVRYSIRES